MKLIVGKSSTILLSQREGEDWEPLLCQGEETVSLFRSGHFLPSVVRKKKEEEDSFFLGEKAERGS